MHKVPGRQGKCHHKYDPHTYVGHLPHTGAPVLPGLDAVVIVVSKNTVLDFLQPVVMVRLVRETLLG